MRTRSPFRSNRITLVALLLALVASAVQVTPVYAASIAVNSNEDTRLDDGKCTLREAVDAANLNTGSGTMPGECAAGSASGVDTISFAVSDSITVGSQLPIASPILIRGGLVNTIIQANANPALAQHRVFVVGTQGNLTLENVTVRHGSCFGTCQVLGNNSPNSGAGISNAGVLTIRNSTISDNSAVVGAGIWNGGTLIVENSVFLRNTASNGGGGIWNQGTLTVTGSTFSDNAAPNGGGLRSNGGSANITNSTFSGNSAQTNGGGVFNDQSSTVTLTNSTFSGNSALSGGGIYNGDATVNLRNTIVANSLNSGNCAGTITNTGGNLDSGVTCGFGFNNNSLSNTNPNLNPLAENGGPTKTFAPVFPSSSAIGKGVSGFCPPADQRGVKRPSGTSCDIGAFETFSIVVDTPADTIANDGLCSLREAIMAANNNIPTGGCESGSDSNIDSIRVGVDAPITLGSQLPVLTSPMIITGEGPARTIIQANASPNVAEYRVFEIASSDVTLNQLTVRHGRCAGFCSFPRDGGGGIYTSGFVNIINSVIADNTALGNGSLTALGHGGGIWNNGLLYLTNSTISGNSATNQGGGVFNRFFSRVVVTNSTFFGNSAEQGGGLANNYWATVASSTFAGNSAVTGGGIYLTDIGDVSLKNTIVADNPSGGNCYLDARPGSVFSEELINLGGNLDSGDTCGFNFVDGSQSGRDPRLGPLADNGGLTPTMALLADSPAIDGGLAANCQDTDQRGGTRPAGTPCDIGAFEFGATVPVILAPKPGEGPDTTGVFRPSNGIIFLKNTHNSGFADVGLNYGIPGDYPVVGDWDGDGDVTIGVYRNGQFFLRNSNDPGFADLQFAFGQPGDQPIAGDWDGDGLDTIGVFRPANGQFLLRNSNDAGAADVSFFLGNAGDVGIAGDWDGDGLDTTGVFRPVNGVIFLKNTNNTGFADIGLNYGAPGDKPVTGDWDDDGDDTIGVYRNGRFFLRNSNDNGFAEIVFDLGNPGDMPIAGNWDGLP